MSYDTDQGELIAALERNILRISFALEGGVVLFSLFFSAAFSRRMRAILNQVGRMARGRLFPAVARPRARRGRAPEPGLQ